MTTKTIRDMLFKQMKKIDEGNGNLDEARAMTELGAQAIYSTRVELENKRIELELGKADNEVKEWMKRDFSKIQDIKG